MKAYKQYSKSRPVPSAESVKRMKELTLKSANPHPLLGKHFPNYLKTLTLYGSVA